jgi:hypothetical protein
MKTKDIFCLIIRLLGLVFLYQGLSAFPGALRMIWAGFASHLGFRGIFEAVMLVGWPIAVGIWLVRGARWLVRQAYEDRAEPPTGKADPNLG